MLTAILGAFWGAAFIFSKGGVGSDMIGLVSSLLIILSLCVPYIYLFVLVINPRRACAARVTVVVLCVCVSVCVCVCVCLHLFSCYRYQTGS